MSARLTLLLAPGASGGIESLEPHREGLAARGIATELVELPRGTAERAVPVYRRAVEGHRSARIAIGGHSFGGRVASMIAVDADIAGLVLLSYPLHAPGRQEAWDQRTGHWPDVRCPVLLLSGTSDPFARIELLRRAVPKLPSAELVTYPGIGHGLGPVLEDALDRIATFLKGLSRRT